MTVADPAVQVTAYAVQAHGAGIMLPHDVNCHFRVPLQSATFRNTATSSSRQISSCLSQLQLQHSSDLRWYVYMSEKCWQLASGQAPMTTASAVLCINYSHVVSHASLMDLMFNSTAWCWGLYAGHAVLGVASMRNHKPWVVPALS